MNQRWILSSCFSRIHFPAHSHSVTNVTLTRDFPSSHCSCSFCSDEHLSLWGLCSRPGTAPRPTAVKAPSPNHWTVRESLSVFSSGFATLMKRVVIVSLSPIIWKSSYKVLSFVPFTLGGNCQWSHLCSGFYLGEDFFHSCSKKFFFSESVFSLQWEHYPLSVANEWKESSPHSPQREKAQCSHKVTAQPQINKQMLRFKHAHICTFIAVLVTVAKTRRQPERPSAGEWTETCHTHSGTVRVRVHAESRQAPLSTGFSRQEHCSGSHALLQGIFPTQGSNPHLLCLLCWQVGSLPLAPPGKASWTDTHPENNNNNEIVRFATVWMKLEMTILSEGSHREKQIWCHLCVESKQMTYVRNGNRLTENLRTDFAVVRKGGVGERQVGSLRLADSNQCI